MNSTQNGLTVGELTIAISVLILGGLIWTAIKEQDNSQGVSNSSLSQTSNKRESSNSYYEAIVGKKDSIRI
jgi:hypothetical protein